jgi:hypothetical protein
LQVRRFRCPAGFKTVRPAAGADRASRNPRAGKGHLLLTGKCVWPRFADITQAAFFGSDEEQADRDDAEEAIFPVTVADVSKIIEKAKEV